MAAGAGFPPGTASPTHGMEPSFILLHLSAIACYLCHINISPTSLLSLSPHCLPFWNRNMEVMSCFLRLPTCSFSLFTLPIKSIMAYQTYEQAFSPWSAGGGTPRVHYWSAFLLPNDPVMPTINTFSNLTTCVLPCSRWNNSQWWVNRQGVCSLSGHCSLVNFSPGVVSRGGNFLEPPPCSPTQPSP